MDLFEKCEKYKIVEEYREKGIYPYFHALETRQDVEVVMEGKRRIMLGSNNYLGLTTEPSVIEAGVRAFEQYGSGCSGSRFLNGTLTMHLELERELAEFVRMLNEKYKVVFIVGHNPTIGAVCEYFSNSVIEKFPTCAIFGLEFEAENFAEISEHSGKVLLFDYPNLHLK